MSETTAISWTDSTWNPWQGCTKVSPGCAHCYMFRDKVKYGQDPTKVIRSKDPTFYKPLGWKEPRKVFTCSWSDFFHEDADEWRDEAWDVIRRTPQHTYQILTKRPERIADHLPADWYWKGGWPNVWLGTSVENQRWTCRIDELLKVPAVVHFISAEPLLGPLDLSRYLVPRGHVFERISAWGGGAESEIPRLDWVIVGGESGPGFRAMQPEWARAIRDQCIRQRVAFWYKQDSGLRPGSTPYLDGMQWYQFPQELA